MNILNKMKQIELNYESLRKNKIIKNSQVYTDTIKLEDLFNKWIQNKRVSNYTEWAMHHEKAYIWDFIETHKKNRTKKLSKLEQFVAYFEISYNLDIKLLYSKEDGTIKLLGENRLYSAYDTAFTITDDPIDGVADITELESIHKAESSLKTDKIITRYHINDRSGNEHLLQKLFSRLDVFLPMIITYDPTHPLEPKHFLVSIPQYANFTELSKNFSQQINALHSDFFKHPPKGRRQTKHYYQSIFNEHFPILRKSLTVEKTCKKIAELYKEKHDYEISWQTVWRNYYQAWKKEQKVSGKKKKVGIKR